MRKSRVQKKPEIIVSKEVDGNIGGITVGICFLLVAVLAMLNPSFFYNTLITTIVMWFFLTTGLPITIACLLRSAPCNSNRLAHGFFFGCISAILFLYINFLLVHIIAFIIGFLALFTIVQDMIFLLRAWLLKPPTSGIDSKKVKPKEGWFVVITTMLALILAAIPILQNL